MLRTRIEEVLNDETFVPPSSAASDSGADDTIQKEDLQVFSIIDFTFPDIIPANFFK